MGEEHQRPDIKFSIGPRSDGTIAALGSIELKMVAEIKDPTLMGDEDHTNGLRAGLRSTIALEIFDWLKEWAPDVLEEYAVEVRGNIVRDPMEMVDYLERHEPEALQDAYARYRDRPR